MDASRKLFNARGFHSTSMAELASSAQVSVGQIYRHFAGKDDIIVAIVEQDASDHLDRLDSVFAAVDSGQIDAARGIELFAFNALSRTDEALSFEILAESFRNARVAETVQQLTTRFRDIVRRLALRVQPNLDPVDLEASVEIITACFYGLRLRKLSDPSLDAEQLSRTTACLIFRGLAPHV
jgi:AcrR family transcriptional regulator